MPTGEIKVHVCFNFYSCMHVLQSIHAWKGEGLAIIVVVLIFPTLCFYHPPFCTSIPPVSCQTICPRCIFHVDDGSELDVKTWEYNFIRVKQKDKSQSHALDKSFHCIHVYGVEASNYCLESASCIGT